MKATQKQIKEYEKEREELYVQIRHYAVMKVKKIEIPESEELKAKEISKRLEELHELIYGKIDL